MEFLDLLEEKLKLVEMDPAMHEPRRSTPASPAARRSATRSSRWRCSSRKLAILDETDSGLDIDALRIVADGVNKLRRPDNAHDRRHALPAAAQLHRARLRARARRRPDREVRRQGAGARARGQAATSGWRTPVGAAVMTRGVRAGVRGLERGTATARVAPTGWSRSGAPPWSGSRGPDFPAARDEEWRFTPIGADRAGTLAAAPTGGDGRRRPGAARAVRLRARGVAHAGLRERASTPRALERRRPAAGRRAGRPAWPRRFATGRRRCSSST